MTESVPLGSTNVPMTNVAWTNVTMKVLTCKVQEPLFRVLSKSIDQTLIELKCVVADEWWW